MSKRRKRQELFRILVKAFEALEKITGVKFPKGGLDNLVRKLSDSTAPSEEHTEEDQKSKKSER